MAASEKITDAWKVAAADLGFTFVSPYELEDRGRKIQYAGLIRDFGSDKGMLIFISEDFESQPWARVALEGGFGYSFLGETYEVYNREAFIATLDDWGWSPKERLPPAWYTGKPWTT